VCIPNQILLEFYKIKKNEVGESYSIYGGEERCIQGFGEGLERNRPLVRIRRTWDDNIKIDLQEMGWAGAWIGLLLLRIGTGGGSCKRGNEPSGSIQCGELLDWLRNC
jgi:hypothetical protein